MIGKCSRASFFNVNQFDGLIDFPTTIAPKTPSPLRERARVRGKWMPLCGVRFLPSGPSPNPLPKERAIAPFLDVKRFRSIGSR